MRTDRPSLKKTWLRHFRFGHIDRYILGEVVGPLIGGLFFLSFVILMFQALRLADFFIVHGVAANIVGKMAALMLLSFLPIALPVAFLIGVLVGFDRLSSDSELIAMKANGISTFRMSLPVFGLGLVVAAISLALNLDWVPKGDRAFKATQVRVGNTRVASSIKEGTFTSGFFDLLIYADKHDEKTNRLHRVFIYDERDKKNPTTVVAKEGEIIPVKMDTELGAAVMLKLYNGNIHSSDPSGNTYQKIDFGEYKLYLRIDEGGDSTSVKPKMYPYRELLTKLKESEPGSRRERDYRTELWRRYSVAMSPLIFVLLGIGYGTIRTRAVRAGAALVVLVSIFIYWTVQAAAITAAQQGKIDPILAMQLPNLIMLALALPAYRSASW